MAEADGFLGRWARRKNAALQGEALPEPVVAKAEKPAPIAPAAGVNTIPAPSQTPAVPEAPPLTVQDAQQLTPDSDFKPFMNRAVQPEVRNAAMKQLFSDPHFNVMDGLDIYIDDYSKPDPLPLSMLKQMASAKFLKLVEEEEEEPKPQEAAAEPNRVSADEPAAQSVAQSAPVQDEPDALAAAAAHPTPEPAPAALAAPQEDNAHPDLRLQPDHAARTPDVGGGPA